MGCWYATDLITQLPIIEGEEVALIPIEAKRMVGITSADNNISCKYFKPYPVILYGTYNDYGIIENVTGDIKEFKTLVRKISESTTEDIIYDSEREVDKKQGDILNFIRYIERGHISSIGLAMVHKSLFDRLMVLNNNDITKLNIENLAENFVVYINQKSILKGASKNEKLQEEYLKKIEDYTNSNYNALETSIKMKFNKESVAKTIKLDLILNKTRIMWKNQTGKGGQTQYEEPHKKIKEFMNNYIKKFKPQKIEDGDWNETDYITKFPIRKYDKVSILVLRKKQKFIFSAEDNCYHNEFFLPLPIVLKGEYLGKGNFKLNGDIEAFKEFFIEKDKSISDLKKELNTEVPELNIDDMNDIDVCFNYVKYCLAGIYTYMYIFEDLYKEIKDFNIFYEKWKKNEYRDCLYTLMTLNTDTSIEDLRSAFKVSDEVLHFDYMIKTHLDNLNKDSVGEILAINSVLSVIRKEWFIYMTNKKEKDQDISIYKIIAEEYEKLYNEWTTDI